MAAVLRIGTRNAGFQQWEALLANRKKRQRSGEFLVHGVRPITMAVERGWPVRALLYDAECELSAWARRMLEQTEARHVAMAPDLLWELGEKTGDAPELIAVAALPEDDFGRIPATPDFLGVVFDRPTSPGNVGTLIRSADAFGASGLVVTGHAADPYDPKSVRASTGSVFALPVVRESSPHNVLAWVGELRAEGIPVTVLGGDETADTDIAYCDLTGPCLVVVGNETRGMSTAWREACDAKVRIPIAGSASSLNAASAATVILYEATRQRGGY